MLHMPRRVEKPWGFEVWWAETEQYLGKILHVDEGKKISWQYHNIKDETMHCLRGEAILIHEDEHGIIHEDVLPIGQSFRIKPGTKHRLKGGIGGCDVLEASTPQSEDVVRLEDDYGRIT